MTRTTLHLVIGTRMLEEYGYSHTVYVDADPMCIKRVPRLLTVPGSSLKKASAFSVSMMQPIRLESNASVLSNHNNRSVGQEQYRSVQQEPRIRSSASGSADGQKGLAVGGPSSNFDHNQSKLYHAVKLQQIQQSR